MTETVLKEIVHRAVREGSFRAQLRTDPAKALAGYDVTAEERTAITTGDPTRLSALGVDQRMSKAYSAGLLSDAGKMVIATDVGSGGAAFIDEGSAAGPMVIVGDPETASFPHAFETPNGDMLDAGFAGGTAASASAFESTAGSGGGTAAFDPGAPTGGYDTVSAEDSIDGSAAVQGADGVTDGTQVDDLNQGY
jgi:hypothetical protein